MMSEKEKKSGGGAGGSPVVLVESAASKNNLPFRPTEMQDEGQELHHKRSRAPAVPSAVADDNVQLKDNANSETNDRRESERALSSETQKHSKAKNLSKKKQGLSPEAITLAQLQVDMTRGVTPPQQPIPESASTIALATSENALKLAALRNGEDESMTDEITELQTPEVSKKASVWSDEQQASGLSRSESCATRVSRVVRQLMCCGTRVESPSEQDISPRSYEAL